MSLIVNIKKKIKDFTLDINFETQDEYLGILGESGSGKSMTLKCIAGIETPDKGEIILNGRVLFDSTKKINLKPQERKIGYLFQNYALFPHMTVEQNIIIALKGNKNDKKEKLKELISKFNLSGLEKVYPFNLSGGQQQRVAMVRAIASNPEILILDEPFSALDINLKDEMQREVLEFLRLYSGEVLMVTHNKDEAFRFCENLVIINKGRRILFGKTKEIFKDPKLMEVAKLLGYKSFSKIKVLENDLIEALDWNIIIEVSKRNIRNKEFIALNLSSLNCYKDKDQDLKNIFKFEVKGIEEEITNYSLLLGREGAIKEIAIKVEKNKGYEELKKIYLEINEESLIFLN